VILIPVAVIQFSGARGDPPTQVTYTQYRMELARDNIAKATIQAGSVVSGDFKQRVSVNGREVKKFTVRLPVENSPVTVCPARMVAREMFPRSSSVR
ncbi:MAG TPA: hypothetical protein VFV33_19970, partial [Gemmatimonadaceae bacterium]|nr:hypothetical protein [Gemmatimonadaceae bacterium]